MGKNVLRIAPMQHQQRRAKHAVPTLTNLSTYAENGIPGLFSKKAFDTAWTEYQEMLVDNLNRLTDGQPKTYPSRCGRRMWMLIWGLDWQVPISWTSRR